MSSLKPWMVDQVRNAAMQLQMDGAIDFPRALNEIAQAIESHLQAEPVGEPDLYVASRQPKRGDGQVWIGWPPQHPEDLKRKREQGWSIGEYFLAPQDREREAMERLKKQLADMEANDADSEILQGYELAIADLEEWSRPSDAILSERREG